MKMKALAVVTFAFALATSAVEAAVVTVSFGGTIDSSTYLPIGTAYTGIITFDSSASPSFVGGSNTQYPALSMQLSFGAESVVAVNPFFNAIDSGGQFRAGAFAPANNSVNGHTISFASLGFTFANTSRTLPTVSLLNSGGLSPLLDFRADSSTNFENDTNVVVSATSAPDVVPLPGGLALYGVMLILACVGISLRRRQLA
jgi:hypothetical protein